MRSSDWSSDVCSSDLAHDVDEDLAVADLRERPAEDRLDDLGDVLGRLLEAGRVEDGAHVEDGLGNSLEVARDQQGGKPATDDVARLVVEAAADPEVEVDDGTLGVAHEVSGVDVAVEEAVPAGRLHPRPHTPLGPAAEAQDGSTTP